MYPAFFLVFGFFFSFAIDTDAPPATTAMTMTMMGGAITRRVTGTMDEVSPFFFLSFSTDAPPPAPAPPPATTVMTTDGAITRRVTGTMDKVSPSFFFVILH